MAANGEECSIMNMLHKSCNGIMIESNALGVPLVEWLSVDSPQKCNCLARTTISSANQCT